MLEVWLSITIIVEVWLSITIIVEVWLSINIIVEVWLSITIIVEVWLSITIMYSGNGLISVYTYSAIINQSIKNFIVTPRIGASL